MIVKSAGNVDGVVQRLRLSISFCDHEPVSCAPYVFLLQSSTVNEQIKSLVVSLYGTGKGRGVYTELCKIMRRYAKALPIPPDFTAEYFPLDRTQSILITYGDQFRRRGEKPLKTLGRFLNSYTKHIIPGVHILPFFPYTSDDGFSITDYTRVNPHLGTWRHISEIGRRFTLMCDLVLNHMSAASRWCREFLKENPRYADYFITVKPGSDLSAVVRPRALPLLHRFKTRRGEKLLWTTFSKDQVDLNYKNPRVLLDIIDILLMYISRGARIIRLDAIAYLWKEAGTSCIHLPQVHTVVRLFRALLDRLAPWVLLITETNVPHAENVSYFGDGGNEAHMVYQFSLPPLVLHSFKTGDASALSGWARGLRFPKAGATFFNFLASHDGIGLLPVHDILSPAEIQGLVRFTEQQGGRVSYKHTEQGSIPYELNISYLSAVTGRADSPEVKAKKFLASQAIMLAFRGVPGIYVHSLLGSENDTEGVEKTGSNRAINRQKLSLRRTQKELRRRNSLRSLVYTGYARLLKARSSHPAFHALGGQRVIAADPRLFVLLREGRDGKAGAKSGDGGRVLCIHNVSGDTVEFRCSAETTGQAAGKSTGGSLRDIITGTSFAAEKIRRGDELRLNVSPFQVLWLTAN